MPDVEWSVRCQRCGTPMDLRDPAPEGEWKPDQFWVCTKCGRHFWTTYATPSRPKSKAASATTE